ncbi:rCG21453 [Rattus norvegicus]|nr:rCG21453 [Rattus norvegicus]
MAFIRH